MRLSVDLEGRFTERQEKKHPPISVLRSSARPLPDQCVTCVNSQLQTSERNLQNSTNDNEFQISFIKLC